MEFDCHRELITNSEFPIVFPQLMDWDLISWDLDKWSRILGDKEFPFRKGRRLCRNEPVWERLCTIENLSVSEFLKCCSDEEATNRYFLYCDYKHIIESFKDILHVFESVSWIKIGFPERNAENSTLWMGSLGAHTPAHIDTYGFNVVTQVYGRKRWLLFPPSETANLKPTRVPYEESSIYSDINFSCYDSFKDRIFEKCYHVDLNPGDVLFVPARWWHYVENLSTAISINTWIPHTNDKHWRFEEAIVRYYISSFVSAFPNDLKAIFLNPNESDIEDKSVIYDILKFCQDNCARDFNDQCSVNDFTCRTCTDEKHIHKYKFVRCISTNRMKQLMMEISLCRNLKNIEDEKHDIYSKIVIEEWKSIINLCCNPEAVREMKSKLLQR